MVLTLVPPGLDREQEGCLQLRSRGSQRALLPGRAVQDQRGGKQSKATLLTTSKEPEVQRHAER